MAVNGRFPPWRGLTIGLNALVLTPEPISPGDDDMLCAVLGLKLRRMRVVPLGIYRINLGQEAMALAMHTDPSGAFTEGGVLADLAVRAFPPVCSADRDVTSPRWMRTSSRPGPVCARTR